MKSVLRMLLLAYQLFVSPMLGQNCRFYPSCSNYALEAIAVHGAARGSLLAARRLCHCHPWHAGGLDPVPPVKHLHRPLAVATTPDKCPNGYQ